MPLPMFLPINETGQSVTLPGLAPEPGGTAPLFPPGTYPIMGSGDYTGTLYPLADPLPSPGIPLPAEVAPIALPPGMEPGGILPQELIPPAPLDFPQMPQDFQQSPGIAPLTDPLPTSVQSFQQAWPPFPEPAPQVPLYPPEGMPMPQVEAAPPAMLPPPEVPILAAESLTPFPVVESPPPGMLPLPDVALQGPALPTFETTPLTGPTTSGMQSLVEAMQGVVGHDDRLRAFREGRNVLRAPVPDANLGRVVWEKTFGGEG